MSAVLAAIRPDDWNLPLFLHVLGALLLVGGLMSAVLLQYAGWSRREAGFAIANARITFRTLLFVALPAWFLMRIGAQWIYDKENFDSDNEPGWVGIGWITADTGGILLLVTIILAGFGARRARRTEGTGLGLTRTATILATLALIAYLVAIWAMSAKPD